MKVNLGISPDTRDHDVQLTMQDCISEHAGDVFAC